MANRRRARQLTLALAVLAAASAAPGTAEAEEPGLSVRVDDGIERAVTGDEVVYTVTVRNRSGQGLEDLRLEQRLPKEYQSASSPGGEVVDGWIVWTVDVPAESETTVETTVHLSEDLPLGREAGTVACAYLRGQGLPEDCGGESAELSAAPSEFAGLPWIAIIAVPAAAALAALGVRAYRAHPLYAGAHRRRGPARHAQLGALHRHILSLSGLRITQRR
ncbi:DUF11 domain-containing protein [Glycomyces salinus]|uniref:DUF11 domain-containing protein n=1 Tax=Glycomyces salinus TaxID=980294 RepID=UPI0018ED3542|nr:DUF11 domain-containing protein [Glycomyces salinus]